MNCEVHCPEEPPPTVPGVVTRTWDDSKWLGSEPEYMCEGGELEELKKLLLIFFIVI